MQDLLGLQSGAQGIPTELNNNVQPVVEIGPRVSNIIKNFVQTASTSGSTIYTTPADKDFFVTFSELGLTKDAASDNVQSYIDVMVGGARIVLSPLYTQTTTAGTFHCSTSYPYPLKIDRNSTIRLVTTHAAGTKSAQAIIGGFILE